MEAFGGLNEKQPAFSRKAAPGLRRIFCLAGLISHIFSFGLLADQSITLIWDPSPDTNVFGYALYNGTASGSYASRLDVGTNTVWTVSGLVAGFTDYFVVTAYDKNGLESDPSNEIAYYVPGGFVVNELATLTFTNRVAGNWPLGAVNFSLSNAPPGAVINATNGVFTWTPSEGQGPSTNYITVLVRTNGIFDLWDSVTYSIIVNDVSIAPVLPTLPDLTIMGRSTLVATNQATDPDIPAETLTYQLINPPAGAVIDTNGVITWTPLEIQVPSTNVIETIVTGYNPRAVNPQLMSATNRFTVTVLSTNSPFGTLVIHVLAQESGSLSLTWTATPGFNYQLQYASGLNQPAWSNLGGPTIAISNSITTYDTNGPDQQRFYRVVYLNDDFHGLRSWLGWQVYESSRGRIVKRLYSQQQRNVGPR